MKKYLFLLAAFLAAITSCRKSKETFFVEWAKDYTRHCPVVLDEFTRVDSMVYVPSINTNRYYYTVTGEADNAASFPLQQKRMRETLIHEVANSISLKPYKDHQATLEYIYYSDRTKKELLRITISPDMYDSSF